MNLVEEALLFLETGEITTVTEELLDEIYLQEQINETEFTDPEFTGAVDE
jgi:hypothetical protein